MSFAANVLQVMIASPSDVKSEREEVRAVLGDWNAINARTLSTVLLPIGWDTHSAPALSGRPQQIINDKVLSQADLLVGIFWTRLGTPTGKAESGTVEEIKEHHAKGLPTLLYFSEEPVRMKAVDSSQYDALQAFKAWALEQGIVHTYEDTGSFRETFRRHLDITLRNEGLLSAQAVVAPQVALTENVKRLLRAANAGDGSISVLEYMGGTSIQAGNDSMCEDDDRRAVALWKAVVREAEAAGLIEDPTGKGEVYEMTHSGYVAVDEG